MAAMRYFSVAEISIFTGSGKWSSWSAVCDIDVDGGGNGEIACQTWRGTRRGSFHVDALQPHTASQPADQIRARHDCKCHVGGAMTPLRSCALWRDPCASLALYCIRAAQCQSAPLRGQEPRRRQGRVSNRGAECGDNGTVLADLKGVQQGTLLGRSRCRTWTHEIAGRCCVACSVFHLPTRDRKPNIERPCWPQHDFARARRRRRSNSLAFTSCP